jgi:hypothetical protein
MNVLTVLILPFHKPIEVQAISPQIFLHISQGFFVRIGGSERDVKTHWKEKTCLCIVKFVRIAIDCAQATQKRHMDRLSQNLPACSYITLTLINPSLFNWIIINERELYL